SDIAQRIATALEAKLAPEEKARLDAKPTTNSEAYVLYLTARGTEDYVEAEKIYLQAIALDPGFALAYARASMLNSQFPADDRAHKAKARAQAEEALRLSPALGEAHMALGLCLYWGEKKYDAALKEFETAAATSPNNAAGRKILENISAGVEAYGMVIMSRWDLAMLERDYATAETILADSRVENFSPGGDAPKTYYQGRMALARGDIESAQRYFAAATPDAEKRVRDNPDVAERHAVLGLLYAYMQTKDDAIREARRAV